MSNVIPMKPRATVNAWRNKEFVFLYLSGAGLATTIDLTPEEATALGEKLLAAAKAGPRIGTPADLGCEAL